MPTPANMLNPKGKGYLAAIKEKEGQEALNAVVSVLLRDLGFLAPVVTSDHRDRILHAWYHHPLRGLLHKLLVVEAFQSLKVHVPYFSNPGVMYVGQVVSVDLNFDSLSLPNGLPESEAKDRIRAAMDYLSVLKWTTGSRALHKNNPYHNVDHCVNVVAHAFDCMRVELGLGWDETFFNENLFIAGMFHDFNHSGRERRPDAENIQEALDGLQDFCGANDLYYRNGSEVVDLIRVTEFLGPDKGFALEPLTLEEMCIRDADLMSITTRLGQRMLFNLALELKVPPMQFAEKNLDFLKGCQFYTVKGQQVHAQLDMYHDQMMETFHQMIQILGDVPERHQAAEQRRLDVINRRRQEIERIGRSFDEEESRYATEVMDLELIMEGCNNGNGEA